MQSIVALSAYDAPLDRSSASRSETIEYSTRSCGASGDRVSEALQIGGHCGGCRHAVEHAELSAPMSDSADIEPLAVSFFRRPQPIDDKAHLFGTK